MSFGNGPQFHSEDMANPNVTDWVWPLCGQRGNSKETGHRGVGPKFAKTGIY